jgi:hypothetical protein
MNTRVGTLTVEHVNALNAVPLEFHKDKQIMQSWRTYLDHLNHQNVALMRGEKTLPLDARSIAQDPEAAKRIADLQDALTKWLQGKCASKAKIDQ